MSTNMLYKKGEDLFKIKSRKVTTKFPMVDFKITLPTTSKQSNILTTYWLSEIKLKGPGNNSNTLITIRNSITWGDAGGNCMVTDEGPATKYAPCPALEPSVKISGHLIEDFLK